MNNNVWKIASRWSDNGEDIEEDKLLSYFDKYQIVFAGRNTDYIKLVQKNDIIAVSDGVVVKAVAIATNSPILLSNLGVNELKNYYNGDEPTIAIPVILHKLNKSEYFSYNRGVFHKIHGTYKDIVIELLKKKTDKTDIINNTETDTFIKDILIKNYNGIIKTEISEIPDNTKWIFLTGNNGYGKTSVLRAIMVGLQGETILSSKEDLPEGTTITFLSNKIKNIPHKNIIENKPDKEKTFVKFSDIEKLAAYGTKRTDLKDTKYISDIHENIFDYNNSELINFEIRFKDWNLFPDKNKLKIENFEILLKLLIPNLKKIAISEETSEVIYYELSNDNEELPPVTFNKLGMGMRSTIAMICDMVFRFSNFEFEIKNDSINITGIVLIDEFDNHLHPKWQRELVEKLSKIFPRVQFIVSTHSPIPLLVAPPDRTVILNVNRTKEQGITIKRLSKIEKELPNLLPNVLLTSPVFGLENIKSTHNCNIEDIIVNKNYNDKERYDALDKSIDEFFKLNKL